MDGIVTWGMWQVTQFFVSTGQAAAKRAERRVL